VQSRWASKHPGHIPILMRVWKPGAPYDCDGKIVTEQPRTPSHLQRVPPCRPSIHLPVLPLLLVSQPPPPRHLPCWPPMLSSFISRRKVKKKISLFDAALGRTPSSPPLEVQSDQENPRSKQRSSHSRAHTSTLTSLRTSTLYRQSSPKVHLDFIPSGSNDWFPREILAPPDEDDHLPIQPVPPESTTSSAYDDVVVIGPELVSFLRSFLTSRLSRSRQSIPSSRDPVLPCLHCRPMVAHPQSSPDTMYVLSCFTLSASPTLPSPFKATTPPLSRKPAPAPIKIPTHPSKVQIQRSASTNYSGLKETNAMFSTGTDETSNTLQPGTANPSSAASLHDDSSAISGTTLARALIANSFILSNDNHGRARYKSGGNLARQDSATLPGASDNGLLISPYWRDRRISGGEIVHSPDSGVESGIPPVPPIPANLSSAMSHVRHLSTEVPRKPPSRSQSLRIDRLSHRASKKSEPQSSLPGVIAGPSGNPTPAPTQIPASGGKPRPPLPLPPSNQPTLSRDNSSDRSSSNPSTPPRDPPPDLNATSSEPAPVNVRRSQPPPSLTLPPPSASINGEDSSRFRRTPSEGHDEPQRTGVSSNTTRTDKTVGSATSGEDITKVLTAYRFGSPLKSSFPVHLHESPDPSTPSLSPWSGGSRSHQTDTSGSSFPQTPTSATKRSRNGRLLYLR
jgi:hypothetical protein